MGGWSQWSLVEVPLPFVPPACAGTCDPEESRFQGLEVGWVVESSRVYSSARIAQRSGNNG